MNTDKIGKGKSRNRDTTAPRRKRLFPAKAQRRGEEEFQTGFTRLIVKVGRKKNRVFRGKRLLTMD